MNVMNALLIFTAFSFLIIYNPLTGQSYGIAYSQDSWNKAFEKSVKEDKNVLVVFYTPWCKPSNWMDQFVFSQQEVKNTLLSRFITIKVNIDEIEGFELKNKMEIKILPTLLILSSDQRVMERVENVLDKKKMILLLKKYQQSSVLYHSTVKRINESPLWNNNTDGKDVSMVHEPQLSNPIINHYNRKQTNSHSLVLGVYTEYSETSAYLESLRHTIHWPLSVSHFFENDKVRFTIKLGAFEAEEEAIMVRDELENKLGIKSYVYNNNFM